MLLQRTDSLPDSPQWLYELKLDGYRAIAFMRGGVVHLRSRNDNDFSGRYPGVVKGLAKMPDDTVIDGEVIAFDDDGRPSFNTLQNYGSAAAPVIYYVFDVMVLGGRDVMREPLEKRRELLERKVLPKLSEPVRYTSSLDAALPVLVQSVKEQGFEGLVAKRRNSVYEPGLRTGAWMKMRVNRGQEFVIGGYTRGTKTFDALIFGYYEGEKLIYVARTGTASHPSRVRSCSENSKGSCHPLEPERLWVAIEAGALVSTIDGGRTWRDRVAGGPWDTHELAIHRNAPDTLRVSAGDGYFESDDAGATWRSPSTGLEVGYLRSVAIDPRHPDVVVVSASSGPYSAYVAGRSDGRLYRRVTPPRAEVEGHWERVRDGWPEPPSTIAPLLCAGEKPGEMWAADERGVHLSDDGGKSWRRVGGYATSPQHLRGLALVR